VYLSARKIQRFTNIHHENRKKKEFLGWKKNLCNFSFTDFANSFLLILVIFTKRVLIF